MITKQIFSVSGFCYGNWWLERYYLWLLTWYLAAFCCLCLVVFISLFDYQLPYEYLTPLQAAIGVVQKVWYYQMPDSWLHITCAYTSMQRHIKENMHMWWYFFSNGFQGLRPIIPKNTHPKLAELLEKCWQRDPTSRPDFPEIIEMLQQIAKEVCLLLLYITQLHLSFIVAPVKNLMSIHTTRMIVRLINRPSENTSFGQVPMYTCIELVKGLVSFFLSPPKKSSWQKEWSVFVKSNKFDTHNMKF